MYFQQLFVDKIINTISSKINGLKTMFVEDPIRTKDKIKL